MSSSRIQFCSNDSTKSGESPIGSAWYTPELIVCELPLPWGEDLLKSRNIPAGFADVMTATYARRGYDLGLIGIAPDAAYSVPGHYRMMQCTIAEDSVGRFERRVFLVPQESVTEALDALTHGETHPAMQEQDDQVRDVMLCTHGAVDTCCAKFGYPLYALMRKMADNTDSNVRVWRSTHFGGHRFAPTTLDLPSGRYWGRITPQDASALLYQTSPAESFRHLYRGSAAMPDPVTQAIEGELLAQVGWILDEAEISHFDVSESSDGNWKATGSVTLPDRSLVPFEVDCVRTDMVKLKGHCNYDIEIESAQFETSFRLLSPVS